MSSPPCSRGQSSYTIWARLSQLPSVSRDPLEPAELCLFTENYGANVLYSKSLNQNNKYQVAMTFQCLQTRQYNYREDDPEQQAREARESLTLSFGYRTLDMFSARFLSNTASM